MVNLAKLRKKAKEKKEASTAGPNVSSGGEAEPVEPPATVEAAPDTRQAPPEASAPVDRIEAYLATAGEAGQRVRAGAEDVVEPGARLELLTFVIAGEQYAIDIDEVVEIVTPRPVTRVPNADPSIVGVFSLRGAMVMLMDVRRRLGHPPLTGTTADTRIVVVRHDSESVGFFVDRVLRVTRADAAEVEPHPVVHSSEHDESVRGVFRYADSLTIILDLRKLLFSAWN